MSDKDRGAEVGLCADCIYVKVVTSAKRSTFYRCVHPSPALPRYPQLPVRACAGYARRRRRTPGQ